MSIDDHCPKSLLSFCILRDNDDLYTCALNQSDVDNNLNKSFIMQLMDRAGETYVLYTRQGRVGQVGSRATDIFIDKAQAIQEYRKVFREKTGVDWDARYTPAAGVARPGKYQYVVMKHENQKTGMSDAPAPVTIDISPSVQGFIKMIFDINLYGASTSKFGVDTNRLPLGSLGLLQIERASDIIKELAKAISEGCDRKKINDLSSLFYTTIPSAQWKLRPIDTLALLEEKGDLLDILRNACYMGGGVDKSSMEQYNRLECNITQVTDTRTYNTIVRYMQTNVGATHATKLKIHEIYEINKPRERQCYRRWDTLHNKQLLWHGTRMANAVGILTTGFRINPPGVPTTGKMFGNGLYFANASTKSAGYMGVSSGRGLLFLCEVALGNVYELTNSTNVTQLPAGKHSVRGVGQHTPATDTHEMMDDVVVPIGRLNRSSGTNALIYDEYIVYDNSQVIMRYVVVVDC